MAQKVLIADANFGCGAAIQLSRLGHVVVAVNIRRNGVTFKSTQEFEPLLVS